MENIRYAVRVFAFQDNKVVCIKYKKINQGYLDIPGGKIEDGETEIDACKREFIEETGMTINDLTCIGTTEVIYPELNKKFVLKTYVANQVSGEPQDFDENESFWLPINQLRNENKRYAVTHLLDEEMMHYFKFGKLNITFICDSNHNIISSKMN